MIKLKEQCRVGVRHALRRGLGLLCLLAAILALSPISKAWTDGTITGTFNGWGSNDLKVESNTHYTYTFTPGSTSEVLFKFSLNGEKFCAYTDNSQLEIYTSIPTSGNSKKGDEFNGSFKFTPTSSNADKAHTIHIVIQSGEDDHPSVYYTVNFSGWRLFGDNYGKTSDDKWSATGTGVLDFNGSGTTKTLEATNWKGGQFKIAAQKGNDWWWFGGSGNDDITVSNGQTYNISNTTEKAFQLPEAAKGKTVTFTLYTQNNATHGNYFPYQFKATWDESTVVEPENPGLEESTYVKIKGDFSSAGVSPSNWDGPHQNTYKYKDNEYIYTFTPLRDADNQYFRVIIDDHEYYPNNGGTREAKKDPTWNESRTSYDWRGDGNIAFSWYGNFKAGKTYTIHVYVNYDGNNGDHRVTLYQGKPFVWTPRELNVYPKGVTNKTQLENYNGWPIYYLQSDKLNNNRVTPEYQMTKINDNRYELLVTMLDTEEVYVEGFTSAKSLSTRNTPQKYSIEVDNEKLRGAGRLYLAVYEPNTDGGKLSFQDKGQDMPFVSIIGRDWKQNTIANSNNPYPTPCPFDDEGDYNSSYRGKPRDTDYGWQESWIQYNGSNIVKDLNGKVMYTTYWPPKENGDIKFKTEFSVGGTDYNFTLSSDQLTFVPQENGEAKTASQWFADERFSSLKANQKVTSATKDANKEYLDKLVLRDGEDVKYVLYAVDDMWLNGDWKLWTGWGGEQTGGGRWDSQWFINWGHFGAGDRTVTLTPGSTIPLGTERGDMTFGEPKYFKHVYFFLDEKNPQSSETCVLYTMLSYGGGQIAALSRNNYTKGMYQPKLTDTSNIQNADILSVVITSWDSDLTEQQFVVFNKTYNDKKVSDWNSLFTFNEDGSWVYDGNSYNVGDYKYKMQVVVNDPVSGRHTIDVVSNPFTIYQTDQRVSVTPYQLIQKVGTDNEYLTYAESMEDAIYDVVDNNGEITRTRKALKAGESIDFGDATQYRFTDKVLLVGSALNIDASEVNSYSLKINDTPYTVSEKAKQAGTGRFMQIVDAPLATQEYQLSMNYTYSFIDSTTGQEEVNQTDSEFSAKKQLALTVPTPKLENAQIEVYYGTDTDPSTDNEPHDKYVFKYTSTSGTEFELPKARYHNVHEIVKVESPNYTSALEGKASAIKFVYKLGEESITLDKNGKYNGRVLNPSMFFSTTSAPYGDKDVTMNVTNAGNVPLFNRWTPGKITTIKLTENAPLNEDQKAENSTFKLLANEKDPGFRMYYKYDEKGIAYLIEEFEIYLDVDAQQTNKIVHEGRQEELGDDDLMHGGDPKVEDSDENSENNKNDEINGSLGTDQCFDYYLVSVVDAEGKIVEDADEKPMEFVCTVEDLDSEEYNYGEGYSGSKFDAGRVFKFRKNWGHWYDKQDNDVLNNLYYKQLEFRVSYLYPFYSEDPTADPNPAQAQGMHRAQSNLIGNVVKSNATTWTFMNTETPTGIEGLEGDASSVKAGVGFIEVAGRGVEIYNAQGMKIAAGEGRYEVGAGVYVVRVNGHTQKVIVR